MILNLIKMLDMAETKYPFCKSALVGGENCFVRLKLRLYE